MYVCVCLTVWWVCLLSGQSLDNMPLIVTITSICLQTFFVPSVCAYLTSTVGLEGVPHVAVEVVVTSEQEATALWEGHRGYAAYDVVMGVDHELLVGAQVKQAAGGVIRAGGKCVAIGEELQGECELFIDSILQEITCTKSPILKNTASRFILLLVKMRQEHSHRWHWCPTRGQWRSVCTCPHGCPRV